VQQASNNALATALAPGQKRQFVIRCQFDWDGNGAYANVNSDLSSVFESASIDRQMSGTLPSDLEITEGYVGGQLNLTLSGVLADGTPVWKAFSPYSGHALGTAALKPIAMFLDLGVQTSLGVVYLRQFTGTLATATPGRADGNVVITCYDASAPLAAPVTLPTWARDQYTITQLVNNPDTPDSGTVALSWVLEELLRQNGFYQGPPWHPNVVLGWTLNGSGLPSVGTIAIEDAPLTNNAWSFGYGQWNIPQFTPSGIPSTVYGQGRFGKTCFLGATKLPTLSGRGVTYVYGNAHATTPNDTYLTVNTYGSANSNLLGIGAWMFVDPTQTATASSVTFHLEEAHYNFSSASTTDRFPAYVVFNMNHQNGTIGAHVFNEGWGTSWTYASTGTMSTGWHYVSLVLQFTSTAINGSFYIDGVLNASGNGATAAPIGTFTYSAALTNSNLGQVIARAPLQYVQVWYQANTALAGLVQPTMLPTNPNVAIDQSTTRLNWLPDIYQDPGWDTLKDAAAAELGALYVTEAGVVTWDSRATVLSRQVAANSVLTIGFDSAADMQPQADLNSIVNTMPYTVSTKVGVYQSPAYKTTQANQFQVPPNTSQGWGVTNSGVQSIRLGNVSWHPQAQGYGNPSNPGEVGGGGPSGTFTYRDWMTIYSPDFWYDGFTAYTPGSSDPSGQPAASVGLNAQPMLGFVVNDRESRHMRLFLTNSNTGGGILEYAVNDSTPFLHVGGTVVQDNGSSSATYQDRPSVATYGVRSLSYPSSDWVQDATTVATVVQSVINFTRNPHPSFANVDIVGDPRLQLQDVVTLTDPLGLGVSMPASVYGITRSISLSDGVKDSLTLQTF
jgi:hypothetical protein